MRSALRRIWAADSSPEIYSAFPFAPNFEHACRRRVLFPIPGSPPKSTAEPRIKPPPSTRSSSEIPDDTRAPRAGSTDSSGTENAVLSFSKRPMVLASTMVFHWPHSGQRPSHFGSSWPQAEQRYMVEGFFILP